MDDGIRPAIRIGCPACPGAAIVLGADLPPGRRGSFLWLIAASGLGLVWFDDRLRHARLWLLGFILASALTVFPVFIFGSIIFFDAAGGGVAGRLRRQRSTPALESEGKKLPVWRLAGLVLCADGGDGGHCPEQRLVHRAADTNCARHLWRRPVSRSGVVAEYIRDNSSPDAHVAMLGSEPEIYFLARRHSATGYIYTYGLMEPQPFARQMQDEMIREIETHPPEFVVFADNPLSWWRKPGSDPAFSIGGILTRPTTHSSDWPTSYRRPTRCMSWVGKWWSAMARSFTGAVWRFTNAKPP